jgi:hydrogenase maturation protein HypF
MYKTPYDRENTAMAKYKLCSDCLREYNDIENIRRYHAQGISCPRDGPILKLYTNDFEEVETRDPIREAAKLIDKGYIWIDKPLSRYQMKNLLRNFLLLFGKKVTFKTNLSEKFQYVTRKEFVELVLKIL